MKMSEVIYVPGTSSKMKRHQLSVKLRYPDDESGILVDNYVTATGLKECRELVAKLQEHFREQK